MFQLNFDGASKGNPGQTGYGGIIRDHQGKSHLTYYGTIGWNTNNVAELEALWKGLTLAQQGNYFPLIVEGDSQLLINMALKLQQGSQVHKISSSWRLASRLEQIQHWLQENRAVSFKHIKRDGNKPADFLANLGVENEKDLSVGHPNDVVSMDHLSTFQALIDRDKQIQDDSHSDAGGNLINSDGQLAC